MIAVFLYHVTNGPAEERECRKRIINGQRIKRESSRDDQNDTMYSDIEEVSKKKG